MSDHKAFTPGQPVAHWTPGRKARLLEAIQRGQFSREQALAAYPDLSNEELDAWINGYRARGLAGLAVLKIQDRRA